MAFTYRELRAALDTLTDEQLDHYATAYMARGPDASMFAIQQLRICDEQLMAEAPNNTLMLVGIGYPLLVGNRDRRSGTTAAGAKR